jgi:putative drug exporter of the RND superfamily
VRLRVTAAASAWPSGVLLDTLVVRTLLIPSIVMLLGRRNWWPSGWPCREPTGRAGVGVSEAK